MVVSTTPTAEPLPTPADWIATRRRSQVRLSRHDVEAMIRTGIVPEDASTELLHGTLLHKDRAALGEDPSSIGPAHRTSVVKLAKLGTGIDNSARHVETQQPLACTEIHTPEPDFMVLRGTPDNYTDLARPADAFCVIEVADSSYERDAGDKLFGYARAGIVQYVIINLRNRTAEVYTGPDPAAGTYTTSRVIAESESLEIRVGDDEFFTVRVGSVLS